MFSLYGLTALVREKQLQLVSFPRIYKRATADETRQGFWIVNLTVIINTMLLKFLKKNHISKQALRWKYKVAREKLLRNQKQYRLLVLGDKVPW